MHKFYGRTFPSNRTHLYIRVSRQLVAPLAVDAKLQTQKLKKRSNECMRLATDCMCQCYSTLVKPAHIRNCNIDSARHCGHLISIRNTTV